MENCFLYCPFSVAATALFLFRLTKSRRTFYAQIECLCFHTASVIIGFCEEAVDGRLQIADRTEGAALEAPSAQLGKKAFDRVEPGARGRGEVKDEAGMPAEPGPHLGMLMSGVIVEHHVDDPAGRHLTFDGIEKPDKLLMPVTLHAAANDLALQHVERKQGGCAVPLVVVGHRPATPALQRQPRLRAIKRLDLRPLVERQDERMRRRI